MHLESFHRFCKGDNFCDFLFAFCTPILSEKRSAHRTVSENGSTYQSPSELKSGKRDLLYKERIYSQREPVLSLKSRPLSEEP